MFTKLFFVNSVYEHVYQILTFANSVYEYVYEKMHVREYSHAHENFGKQHAILGVTNNEQSKIILDTMSKCLRILMNNKHVCYIVKRFLITNYY